MARRLPTLLAGLVLVAVGCAPEATGGEPSGPDQSAQPLEAAEADRIDPDFDPDFDPVRERAIKKGWQERLPSAEIREVDWQAAKAGPRVDAAQLDAAALARAAQSPVPVLLPVVLADRPMTVTTGDHWYAASIKGDGHTIYVSGTRKAMRYANLKVQGAEPDMEDELRLTRNEAVVSVAFESFGVAYVVEVECAAPFTDARCTEDGYAMTLVDGLGLVEPARQALGPNDGEAGQAGGAR